jgi:hypothetical protein
VDFFGTLQALAIASNRASTKKKNKGAKDAAPRHD